MKQLLIVLFLGISFAAKSQTYPCKMVDSSIKFLYLDTVSLATQFTYQHAYFLISDTSKHFANLISVNGYAVFNGDGYVFFDAHKKKIKAPWHVWSSILK